MEVTVDNEISIEPIGAAEASASNSTDVVVADDTTLDITVTKKEYKIVGDEVYIAKLYEDAPQWMKDLVQLVVDNTMVSESTALLNSLVSQLNQFAVSYVPLNTYTQSILDLSNADTSMHNTLETLNSNFNDGLNTANSQIIDLQVTKASKTEVATKVIETLTAQLATPTSELGATIANLQQTIVDGDSANADSVTTLTSVLEGEVDARATAVNTLNTYVGIDSSGTATGGGLLNSVQELQNQIDGNITTWFYDGKPTLLNAPANMWVTVTDKSNHVGDIYYDKTSGYGYRFAYEDIVDVPDAGVIYSWIRIVDTDVVKALADAANAQETADGKITTFYQSTNPVAEGIGDLWIDSDNGNKMYRWNGSSWGTDLVGTMVASSSAVTALTTELNNGANTWAAADSQVTNSLVTKIANDVASVESKWEYNSVVGINGVYKRSGFGLTTNYSGGSGTKADPYASEFWIDATKLKFTNSAATGSTAPFTIDASGATPQITFNGKVSFSNVTNVPQLGSTPQEVVTAINAGNTTTIDGGKITTGSITANQIAANTITADRFTSTTGLSSVWSGGGLVSSNFNGNVTGSIGTPTQGFRLSSNATGTATDPNVYGAYIKGGHVYGSTIEGVTITGSNVSARDLTIITDAGYSTSSVIYSTADGSTGTFSIYPYNYGSGTMVAKNSGNIAIVLGTTMLALTINSVIGILSYKGWPVICSHYGLMSGPTYTVVVGNVTSTIDATSSSTQIINGVTFRSEVGTNVSGLFISPYFLMPSFTGAFKIYAESVGSYGTTTVEPISLIVHNI